uniref:Hexosyltransferase n=1 Tax=Tetraodon nigroviridis TaxID=99883 RepID=H3CQV6_TETNG
SSGMAVMFRRIRKYHLVTTCLVVSVMVVVCWEQIDRGVVGHLPPLPGRHINRSLTIPRQEARAFSSSAYLLDHPRKCADQDVLLLLFVKSPENSGRRDAIRSTWGNETYIWSALGATIKVLFALVQEQLVQENRLHGDLVQQDFLDSFYNLTLKLLLQIHWMHRRCAHARFLMSADDDVFVHTPNLVRYLQAVAASGGVADFWVGKVHRGAPPIRSKDSKYYVPPEMYPWSTYPDYTAGAAYVVSGDVAERVHHATLTLNASLYIDDVFMGICANTVGVSPRNHPFFSGEGKAPNHPCIYERMMTSHGHVEDLRALWEAATHPGIKNRTSGLW